MDWCGQSKWWAWILVLSTGVFSHSVPGEEEVELNWAPVIIEASKLPQDFRSAPAPNRISFPALSFGESSDQAAPALNSLGFEIEYMDDSADLAGQRRNDLWHLKAKPGQGQAQMGLSVQEKGQEQGLAKVKIPLAIFKNHSLVLKTQSQWDNSKNEFYEDAQTPSRLNDDSTVSVKPKRRSHYMGLEGLGKNVQSLLEYDRVKENLFARKIELGKSQKQSWELSTAHQIGSTNIGGYFFQKQGHFTPALLELTPTRTLNRKWGSLVAYEFKKDWVLRGQVSQEELWREDLFLLDKQRFVRYRGELRGQLKDQLGKWGEGQALFSLSQNHDRFQGQKLKRQLYKIFGQISSTERLHWGGLWQGLFYSHSPTPLQLFGDGAMQRPATDLRNERGRKWSLGPWWANKKAKSEARVQALGFVEEVFERALDVGTSPTSFRTMSLGGVWNRGVEIVASYQKAGAQVKLTYLRQQALNASELNWQRGRTIPGVSKNKFDLDTSYENDEYQLGARSWYRSSQALSLSGEYMAPSEFNVDVYMGKSWGQHLLRLEGKELWPQKKSGHSSQGVLGLAGPDLNRPLPSGPTFVLLYEVLL